MSDLEDAELDQLLERFDQTESALQRKIVGRLMLNIAALEAQRDELAAALRNMKVLAKDLLYNEDPDIREFEAFDKAAESALAKVPKK